MKYPEFIDLLRRMVAVPSFSREEKAVADLLQMWLLEHGMHPDRIGNNLWLDSDPLSDKPVILLNGHIDTVKPAESYTRNPYSADVEDGCIYGLGTNDDGASVVALLGAYLQLKSRPQPYRLVWSATAEEEVGGKGGVECILPEFGNISLGIVGEPTGMRMAVAERGLIVLDCTAHGMTGHAAGDSGENAIYKAVKDIEWFRSFHFDKVSEYLGAVRMTVTMVSAGTQHNVIPDECRFVVDVRPNGMYTNEEIVAVIKSNVSCDVVPRSMKHNGSSIDESHPVIVRGRSLGLESLGSPTSSNQAFMPFPSLKIGPGESSRSHSADEFVKISEIEEAVGMYVRLLDGLAL